MSSQYTSGNVKSRVVVGFTSNPENRCQAPSALSFTSPENFDLVFLVPVAVGDIAVVARFAAVMSNLIMVSLT